MSKELTALEKIDLNRLRAQIIPVGIEEPLYKYEIVLEGIDGVMPCAKSESQIRLIQWRGYIVVGVTQHKVVSITKVSDEPI